MAVRQLKTPPEAVDRVYAQSLFELIEPDGGREGVESMSGELDELLELTRQMPELGGLFDSQIIASAKKQAALRAIFGDGRVSQMLLQFLLVLNRKERLNRFEPIATAFEELVREKFGRVEVDVWTRYPLASDQLENIRKRLQSVLKREPIMHSYTDEGMIGGVRMQVGDQLIDASIATQLRKMRKRLMEDGSSAMRDRFDAAIDNSGDDA